MTEQIDEINKLRALVFSLVQLTSNKTFIVSCDYSGITCPIIAHNRDEIIELFNNYATKLYNTNGRLYYDDGTSFRLFKVRQPSPDTNGPIVTIDDLGYFSCSLLDYSRFIDVLAELMSLVIYKKQKNASMDMITIVKKYLQIAEPEILITDKMLQLN